jgi:hypothetical protein
VSLLFNARSLLIVVNSRSPHTSFREAFPHHQVEVVIDHPQLLFQYLANYDAMSEVQSKIFKYFFTSFWKSGLIPLAMFDKGAAELSPNGLTYQGIGGDVQNGPGCATAATAGLEYSKRDVVISLQGLAAPESGEVLGHEPVEATDEEWLFGESTKESKELSWDRISMEDCLLSQQVGLREDRDECELLQKSLDEKLQHELEDKIMRLRRTEKYLKEAEEESAKSAGIIKILEAELKEFIVVGAEQCKKIRDLESESRTKTEEYATEKARVEAAEQEQVKLNQKYDRQLELQDYLWLRLNQAKEDRERERQEYDESTKALKAQYREESRQVGAKLKVQHEEEVEDLKSKLDLSEETITNLQSKLKSKDMTIANLTSQTNAVLEIRPDSETLKDIKRDLDAADTTVTEMDKLLKLLLIKKVKAFLSQALPPEKHNPEDRTRNPERDLQTAPISAESF